MSLIWGWITGRALEGFVKLKLILSAYDWRGWGIYLDWVWDADVWWNRSSLYSAVSISSVYHICDSTSSILILQHNLMLSDDRLTEILHEPHHTNPMCVRERRADPAWNKRRADDISSSKEPRVQRVTLHFHHNQTHLSTAGPPSAVCVCVF